MKTISLCMFALAACAASAQRQLTLDDSLKLARQNSPVLQAARAEVAAAVAAVRMSRAQTNPQLSVNGFATTGNQGSIVGSTPGVEPPALATVLPGTFLDGNVTLMAPLIATRLAAMITAASWQAKAAEGELAETRADLDLRVTEAYYQVLHLRRLIAAAEARLAAAEELVRNTRARFESGSDIEASVSRALAERFAAEREVVGARNQEAKAVLDLQVLIGIDPSEQVVVADDGSGLVPLTLEEALELGKQTRGILAAARARVQAASAELGAVRSMRSPQLFGVLMGDVTNRRDMGGLTVGLALSVPLYDGDRIAAETARVRAMRARAEAQLHDAELMVAKEVRQATLDLQTAQSNMALAESSVRAAQSAYDVIALRVRAGKSILIEQLDALNVLTQSRADLARAQYDVQVATARLLRAAGGAK
jgi:outer membrane protein TolC